MWILAWVECAPSITSSQPFDSGAEIIQIIHVQKNKITTVSLTLSFSLVLLCRVPLGPNSHTHSTVDASLSLRRPQIPILPSFLSIKSVRKMKKL